MDFRSVFDDNRVRISTSFEDVEGGPSTVDRTKQQFLDDVDINKIVARYPDISLQQAQLSNPDLYSEFDTSMDYMKAVEIVQRAGEQFDTLPAVIRDRFKHDPFEFLNYINDPSNKEEAISLGLMKKVEIPEENITIVPPTQPLESVIQPELSAVTPATTGSEPMP